MNLPAGRRVWDIFTWFKVDKAKKNKQTNKQNPWSKAVWKQVGKKQPKMVQNVSNSNSLTATQTCLPYINENSACLKSTQLSDTATESDMKWQVSRDLGLEKTSALKMWHSHQTLFSKLQPLPNSACDLQKIRYSNKMRIPSEKYFLIFSAERHSTKTCCILTSLSWF